jgi:hypothetical protein
MRMLQPAVDIPPMAHPANDDHLLAIIDVIQDAIITHPQPKAALRASKALNPTWPRIVRQVADPGVDSCEDRRCQRAQIPFGGGPDHEAICH